VLQKRDILVFGDDWGRYPSTIQHIGRVLAKHNRIFWIGSLGLRKPTLGLYDVKRVWEKGKNLLASAPAGTDPQGVIKIHPLVLPFHDSRIVRDVNAVNIRRAIRSVFRHYAVWNPVLLTSSPIVGDLIGSLGETSSHYFCLDDYTLFEGAFESLGTLEKQLIARVDSCFSISDTLLNTRRVRTGFSVLLPQGVDTEHFKPGSDPLPATVANLPHPVVGFFGLLTSWVDLSLIAECARRYPAYTFLVLGRTAVDVSALTSVPNVRYLGEIPFGVLPQYARAFDAGLIPFKVNDLTIACNPLKLLEYLSLGIPVVSTKLPEVEKFSPAVMVAHDREDFISMIEPALRSRSPERDLERRHVAERYSWTTITEEVSRVILRIEEEKDLRRESGGA